MNLDELKATLDTEAQKRNRTQENTIKELQAQISNLHTQLHVKREKEEQHANIIRALQNRCWMQSRGQICDFCVIGHSDCGIGCAQKIVNSITGF